MLGLCCVVYLVLSFLPLSNNIPEEEFRTGFFAVIVWSLSVLCLSSFQSLESLHFIIDSKSLPENGI